MGKVQFIPPTEEDATTRKLYGGGKATAPTGKSGRGWHKDYERHVEAAHKGWDTRKQSDRVPDSNKEFSIHYPESTDPKEKSGWSEDAEKLKHLNKDEEKHQKEDEKIRQRGSKESMKVEQEKSNLEKKIRVYEDKHDDKLKKQIDKEEQIMKERKASEEAYKRDIADADEILEKYNKKERQLQDDKERRVRDGNVRVQKEDFKQTEQKEKLLLGKIQESSVNLNKLRQEKDNNDTYFKRELKNYDDMTNNTNKDLMDQAKVRLKQNYGKDNAEITGKLNEEQKLNKGLKGELESTRKHEEFLKKELGGNARDFDVSRLRDRPIRPEVKPEVKQEQRSDSFDISKLRERHAAKPVEKSEVKRPVGTPKGLSASYKPYSGNNEQTSVDSNSRRFYQNMDYDNPSVALAIKRDQRLYHRGKKDYMLNKMTIREMGNVPKDNRKQRELQSLTSEYYDAVETNESRNSISTKNARLEQFVEHNQ